MSENPTTRNGIVIVPDVAGESAGAVVWWRLAGGVPIGSLAAAWSEQGLDPNDLPDPPSRDTVLHRAVGALAERRRLVRPLAESKGWAIVAEQAAGDDLAYDVAARVRYNGTGVEIDPPDGPVAGEIRAEYIRHDGMLDANDVGGFLVRCLGRADAVALRLHGGVYFVPAHGVESWRRAAKAVVQASGSAIYEVPALKTGEAVEAILDAVTAEAESIAAGVEADLSADGDGGMGIRAIRTRQGRLARLAEKLARYESLCGRAVAGIGPRLESIQAGLAAAALAAEADAAADAAQGAV